MAKPRPRKISDDLVDDRGDRVHRPDPAAARWHGEVDRATLGFGLRLVANSARRSAISLLGSLLQRVDGSAVRAPLLGRRVASVLSARRYLTRLPTQQVDLLRASARGPVAIRKHRTCGSTSRVPDNRKCRPCQRGPDRMSQGPSADSANGPKTRSRCCATPSRPSTRARRSSQRRPRRSRRGRPAPSG